MRIGYAEETCAECGRAVEDQGHKSRCSRRNLDGCGTHESFFVQGCEACEFVNEEED